MYPFAFFTPEQSTMAWSNPGHLKFILKRYDISHHVNAATPLHKKNTQPIGIRS